jgi:hypothetical protein
MMVAWKLLPHLLCFAGITLVLLRGFPGQRRLAALAATAAFALGALLPLFFLRHYPGEAVFGIIRDVVGGSFLLLWGASVAAIYRSTGRGLAAPWLEPLLDKPLSALVFSLGAGAMAGSVAGCRLASDANPLSVSIMLAAAALLSWAMLRAERLVPESIQSSPSGIASAVVALLFYSSSAIIRLDLFSPLTMKVMKFAHDFVHQFFESMLIPDHLFIQTYLWGYIGLLFGKEVGFWGALIILFIPVLLVLLAISFQLPPSVAHIRQGAQRRRILAAALTARRRRLVIPALALILLGASVYRSLYPSVEYWDPKPLPVTPTAAGEIFIPMKGEIDLQDGKLHKFVFKQGGHEVRFFIVLTPDGKLSADLDACAICKPDGYGQAEGTVICYYCKTLIPMETVGKPGGCNPVPVPAVVRKDGVHLDSLTLANTWGSTVQATTKVTKEGGK